MEKAFLHKLLHMARLELTTAEQETMLEDLEHIYTWVEELKAIDTQHIEPLYSVTLQPAALREDTPEPALDHEKALAHAPQKDANYFRVPQVKGVTEQ